MCPVNGYDLQRQFDPAAGQALKSNGMLGGGATAIQAPLAPIQSELSELGGHIEDLHRVIDMLCKRLESVCAPEMPSVAKDRQNMPSPPRSGIASVVREGRARVEQAATRLRSVMDRIEL